MVLYRRNRVESGTYFFTVTLRDRQSTLLIEQVDLLRKAFAFTRYKKPFTIDSIVILPEHIHTIWSLPKNDQDYSTRWQSIKSYFSRNLKKTNIILQPNKRGEYDLWQRRFWEHTIRDEADYEHHVNYIHYNPVKHGLVKQVKDWPYSSFHKYVSKGILPINWGSDRDFLGEFGE
jgi:putative transposase